MKLVGKSAKITKLEKNIIESNLKAFEANFDEIYLYKFHHGAFEVYMAKSDIIDNTYIQYCDNIDYLNGWLYGAVQGALRLSRKY